MRTQGTATHRRARRPRSHGLARISFVLASAGALLTACGGAAAGTSTQRDAVPVHNPLPTSITTSAGTWAAVPMGHLDQPLNTFWQLFFLPIGAALWKNHAANLGMATNGGLLLASPASQGLLVAIRPSNYLRYSALVATTNGTAWDPASPAAGFVDSLAVGPDDQQLALLKDRVREQGARGRFHIVELAEPRQRTVTRVLFGGALVCAPRPLRRRVRSFGIPGRRREMRT